MASICLLLAAGLAKLGWPFYLAWCLGCAYMAWQVWSIRKRERSLCFKAFRQSHWYGVIILAGIVASFGLN
jgi:4-hydroxybenzoate polyprenyltransferase